MHILFTLHAIQDHLFIGISDLDLNKGFLFTLTLKCQYSKRIRPSYGRESSPVLLAYSLSAG